MRTTLHATAVAALLVLTACGSSSGDMAGSTDTASATDTTDAAGDTTGDTTGDYEFTGDDSAGFCAVADQLDENDPLDELSADADPTEVEQQWQDYKSVIDEVAATAPAEIAEDFAKIAGGVKTFGDAYSAAGWDEAAFAEVMQTNPEIQELLASPEFDAAGTRVDAYIEQVCGLVAD